MINPLYDEREIRRVFDRAKNATSQMEAKDEVWREGCRNEFVRALQARVAARSDEGDETSLPPGSDDA